ncbi:hypothetical protein KAU33_09065 [Candidatus Dependentiae bacterium]|nr:hypothetical protein [Candidatus Dependentiae bacterium]
MMNEAINEDVERLILQSSESDFNSDLPIPWDKIKERNTINHKGITYEVAFKSVRKRSVDGFILESNQILYLRPIFQGENVMGEIDEDGNFSLIWARLGESSWCGEPPSTGIGYESWTEEYLNSLKKELNEKIEKIRRLL